MFVVCRFSLIRLSVDLSESDGAVMSYILPHELLPHELFSK